MNKEYNCPNCGAPITGDKCEYCGTTFHKNKIDRSKIMQELESFGLTVYEAEELSKVLTINELRSLLGLDEIEV